MLTRRTCALAATILLGAALAGCGSDDTTTPATVDAFYDARDRAICAFQARCAGYPDVETCLAVTARSREDVTTIAHVGTGSVAYDPSKAATCLAFIDGLPCDVDFAAVQHEFEETCAVVIQGRVEAGSACSFDEDCVAGSFCARPGCDDQAACCAGSCEVVQEGVVVAEGGDCSVNSVCADGTYCQPTTKVCTAQIAAAGAACDQADACASPLQCHADSVTQATTCYASAATGAACDPSVELAACASIADFCDRTAKVCKPLGAPGDACGAVNTPDTCAGYASCTDGTCGARPVEGEACAGSGDASTCLGDLVCTNGACAAPAAATACP